MSGSRASTVVKMLTDKSTSTSTSVPSIKSSIPVTTAKRTPFFKTVDPNTTIQKPASTPAIHTSTKTPVAPAAAPAAPATITDTKAILTKPATGPARQASIKKPATKTTVSLAKPVVKKIEGVITTATRKVILTSDASQVPRSPPTSSNNGVTITTTTVVPVLVNGRTADMQAKVDAAVQRELLDHQHEHFAFMQQRFANKQPGMIDASPKGAGKTNVTILTAYARNQNLLVFGPRTLISQWKSVVNVYREKNLPDYHVKIIAYMTMNALRSSKGRQPKHNYLTREEAVDTDDEDDNDDEQKNSELDAAIATLGGQTNKRKRSDGESSSSDDSSDSETTKRRKMAFLLKGKVLNILGKDHAATAAAAAAANKKTNKKKKKSKLPTFHVTDEFQKLLKQGLVVVIDESQSIKNQSAQNSATSALIAAINQQSHSIYLLLSATPYDTPQNAVSLFRAIALLSQDPIEFVYNKIDRKYEAVSILPLIAKAKQIDSVTTEAVLRQYQSPYRSHVDYLLHQLFIQVFKQRYISMMEAPVLPFDKIWHNAYYTVQPGVEEDTILDALLDLQEMAEKIVQARMARALQKGRRISKEEAEEDDAKEKLSIFPAMHALERVKSPVIARMVRHRLETISGSKALIFTNYDDSMAYLLDALKDYQPARISGKDSDLKRETALYGFQNDPGVRVIIMQIMCGSVGINAQDLTGNAPRYSYILPSFNYILLEQASGRTHRPGLKSHAYVDNCFMNCPLDEARILNNLRNKTQTLKGLIGQKQVLAGDITDWYESGKRAEWPKETPSLDALKQKKQARILTHIDVDVDDSESDGSDMSQNEGEEEDDYIV